MEASAAGMFVFNESATYYFFSTAAQCVAGIAGLSAAFATFHYQNLLGRVREMRDRLYEKYDPMGAGLKEKFMVRYRQCRSIEDNVDFWREYFEREDKNSHHLLAFDELYALIRQTRKFRRLIIRLTVFGFGILLPYGVIGTLLPTIPTAGTAAQFTSKVIFLALLGLYLLMNVDLARAVFVNPWTRR